MGRLTNRVMASAVAFLTIVTAAFAGLAPLPAMAATGWQQILPSSTPPARAGAASTYDSGRGVVVAYGGWDGSRASSDTWEYDGTSWVKRVVANPPPARVGAVMAYDPGLGKSILFGGIGGGDLSDTWGWDGKAWTLLQSVSRPAPRAFAGMAQSAGGHIVLFGGAQRGCDGDGDGGDDGSCSGAFAGDTWEWDGSSWSQKTPATSPSPRGMISLAYAPDRQRSILVGGLGGSGTLQDTWEYDGANWHQVATSGPGARAAYGLSYDGSRARAVLFGGCGGQTSVDGGTWEWDGHAWTNPGYASPGARTGAVQAYDARRARTVLMGGIAGGSCEHYSRPIGDTWELQVPVPGAATGLAVTADEGTIPAGAQAVRLADIPASRVNAMVQAPAVKPYGAVPVGGTQFGGIQFGGIQFGGIQFGGIQFGGIDLSSTQFGGIQFGGIQFGGIMDGLGRIPSGGNSFADVRLSSVPAVDWATVLNGSSLQGLLLQTLTLQQVLADPVAGPRFQQLTLGQTRLNQTILRTVPVGDLLAGTGPLDNIPVPAGFSDWCAYLKTTNWAPAQSCSDSAHGGVAGASVDPSVNSLLGLDIAGADTAGIQFGGIQFGGIGDLAHTPIAAFRLAAMPSLAATQFGGIQVGNIPSPGSVVDCSRVDCSPSSKVTLADAASMSPSAILASARVIDLGSAMATVRVGDVIAGLLPLHDLAWEKLAADGLQDVTPVTPAGVHYHVSFNVPCNGASMKLGVQTTLGKGFRYIPGTSTVSVGGAAAQALSDPAGANPPLTDTPDNLAWQAFAQQPCQSQSSGSQHWILNFQARPTLDLGVSTVSAVVTTPAPASVTDQAPVSVTRNWSNSDPATAPVIGADTIVLGHVASSGDTNYFRFPVPATGSQVSFYLSHMDPGTDYDLTVAKPHVASLLSSQFGGIQFGGIPLADPGAGSNNRDASLAPETLQDIQFGGIPVSGAQFGGIDLAAVSQSRGNADELARVTVGSETGYYTVAVSGYNGSSSSRPFELRVKVTDPPQLPPCPARPSMTSNPTGTLVPPAAIPASTKTLFLVNQQRLAALYPAADVASMRASLASVANRPEVAGQVLNVDGDSNVHAAYDAWDKNPCSIDAANNVVRQVNALVAQYRAQATGVRYIVALGSDEVVPMARVADSTSISNERDYAGDLGFLLQQGGSQQANALYAATALGFYLSDDAYTTFTSTPFDGRELYLPTISSGRVLETAAEIKDQLNAYVTSGGQLNAGSAVTTGYDFLSDGAQSIQSAFARRFGPGADGSLISDTWTKQDLLGKMVPSSGASPSVIDANAHYNHFQLEPAAAFKSSSFTANDILSNGDLPQRTAGSGSPAQFSGRVLFTMGCHAGYNVPDSLLAAPTADQVTRLRDWTQYYAQQMAAVYVANTGYGYGDTETVGLSERLMSLFAQNFADDSLAIGDKLVMAKHAYFDNGAVYDVYDSKVLEQATLYGLPFYRVAGSGTTPTSSPVSPATDPVSGLATANFPVTPSLAAHDTARGKFWSDNNGGVQASLYRPIVPSVSRDVTASGGLVAHGALIKSLATSDTNGVTPALAAPTVDLAGHEPQPNFIDVNFPANLVHLSRSNTFGTDHQRLVVLEGQYRGQGVERLVSGGSVDVAYSSSSDTTPAAVDLVSATRNGASATLVVKAHKASGSIKRVAALYSDAGTWKFVDLDNVGSGTWSKVVSLSTAQDIEVLAQVEDTAGNVAYSTDKGANFVSVPNPPSAPQSLVATGGKHQVSLGWQAPRSGATVSYQVYRGTSAANLAPLAMVSSTQTTYVDQGLPSGTTYVYAVSAVSDAGEGALSNLATATTSPGISPPRNLTASGGQVGQVVLNWQSPATDGGSALTSYNVYRDSGTGYVVVGSAPAAQTTFTDNGLQVLSNYHYYVTAVNTAGEESAPSNGVCARPAPLGGILTCT